MKNIFKFFCWLLLLSFVPQKVFAQFATDNDLPTEATADLIINSNGTTILSGQVDVRQGDTRILADKMKIFGGITTGDEGSNTDDISRIEATGNFYYITPEQEVRGDNGVYLKSSDTFTVRGNVILLQGDNVVTGDTLIYDLKTEEAQVIGTCNGRSCGTEGRVKILLKNSTDNEN
ncbi:LptA/OstA family protein [Hellea sp.]|nr:LptA/OstA family protein [Hellea sp.]